MIDTEFERSILGRIILEPETSDYAFEKLTRNCFQAESHRIIFQHIRDLWETSSVIDTLAVCHELETKGLLEKVGGHSYVVDLIDSAVIPSRLGDYVDKILEAKRCWDINILGGEIIEGVRTGSSSDELVATIEAKINQVMCSSVEDSFSTFEDLSVDSLKHNLKRFLTKFTDFDKKIGGFPQSEFWVVAGRPSVGKTTLGLNLAINFAEQDIPVGFISIEMSLDALRRRIVSSEARVKSSDIQTEEGIEKNREELEGTIEGLRNLAFFFDASASQTITSIRAKAHRLVRLHKIQILFIDYLQLIGGPKSETREREISAISAMLKSLAKDLNLTVVTLAQLNRRCEERKDKRPVLADLRESGAIEQDADGVILLHRPELYGIKTFDDKDKTPTSGVVEVNVAKNRNGDTAVFRLTFLKNFTRFENYQKEE